MEDSNRPSYKGRRGKQRTSSEKFWDFVIVKDGCWSWKGSFTNYGYPQIAPEKNRRARLAGRAKKIPQRGNRISWEIHKGLIPDGLNVLHTCDNTECTNPEHLYLGTQSENMKDAWVRKRRKPKRHYIDGVIVCKYGHPKELLPNEVDKYVCRVCVNSWSGRNPGKAKKHRQRHKAKQLLKAKE